LTVLLTILISFFVPEIVMFLPSLL
jgi:hypothetical protein